MLGGREEVVTVERKEGSDAAGDETDLVKQQRYSNNKNNNNNNTAYKQVRVLWRQDRCRTVAPGLITLSPLNPVIYPI